MNALEKLMYEKRTENGDKAYKTTGNNNICSAEGQENLPFLLSCSGKNVGSDFCSLRFCLRYLMRIYFCCCRCVRMA